MAQNELLNVVKPFYNIAWYFITAPEFTYYHMDGHQLKHGVLATLSAIVKRGDHRSSHSLEKNAGSVHDLPV